MDFMYGRENMKTVLEELMQKFRLRMRILIRLGSTILCSSVILSSVSFAQITYSPTLNLVMMPPTPDFAILLKTSTGNAIYERKYHIVCDQLKSEKELRERDRYIAFGLGVILPLLFVRK